MNKQAIAAELVKIAEQLVTANDYEMRSKALVQAAVQGLATACKGKVVGNNKVQMDNGYYFTVDIDPYGATDSTLNIQVFANGAPSMENIEAWSIRSITAGNLKRVVQRARREIKYHEETFG